MARKTARQLKLRDIAFSPDAMRQLQLAGGEILVMRIVRKLQDEWPTYPRKAGVINVLSIEAAGVAICCLFPIARTTGVAVLTPEEAERSKQAILTGVPDQLSLQRLGVR